MVVNVIPKTDIFTEEISTGVPLGTNFCRRQHPQNQTHGTLIDDKLATVVTAGYPHPQNVTHKILGPQKFLHLRYASL